MEKDRLILGENAIFSTDCSKTGVNNNVIVCGTSGCGKTMSVIEPQLLDTYETNLIVTVSKRKLVKKYKPLFEQRGYTVNELNFASPTESDIAYDPISYVRNTSDITFLAQALVKNGDTALKSVDPYWDDAAISLLSALIGLTMKTQPMPSFTHVLSLLDGLEIGGSDDQIEASLNKRFETLARKEPNHFAVRCWRTFSGLPRRTASCVFSTLNTKLDTIFSTELRRMMMQDEKVNFRKLASRKSVLFVTTSAVNPSLHSFVNLFYAHAIKQLFEFAESRPNGKLPIPLRILCDDFATGGRIQNFPEYISIFREKQISVTLLVQSESQLERMYGSSDATTIINNCDTYLYMGGMDIITGKSVSARIDVPLDEVLYMPVGQLIVFRRGQRPIRTERYNILNNQTYRTLTEQYEGKSSDRAI